MLNEMILQGKKNNQGIDMNIYDISKKAGVSIATVSRVLNGNSKVSEKTRQRILDVMEETGYQPNIFARGLGLNTMNTIGVMCADSSDLVLAAAVYHVEQELHKYQYDVLLCCTGYDAREKEKYMDLLRSKRVDAVILVGSNFIEKDMEKNQYIIQNAKEIPVMLVNAYLDNPNVFCVVCDDRTMMCQATEKFLKNNRRVLYLYRSLSYSGRQKIQGVRDAFEKVGTKPEEGQILLINGTIESTGKKLEEMWENGERWDVIMTSDDELAVGACKFAKIRKLRIPQDLQILGYNNSKISICSEPEISTVDNHMKDASILAVDLLMKILQKEEVSNKTVVKGEMVLRDTTADL